MKYFTGQGRQQHLGQIYLGLIRRFFCHEYLAYYIFLEIYASASHSTDLGSGPVNSACLEPSKNMKMLIQ